ncbi:MAG TPA: hypothetical protein VHP83_22340 [Aggregatilineaceae bacterium]|nr:hypothetical protein [Aggregatilineaceae bacterium]
MARKKLLLIFGTSTLIAVIYWLAVIGFWIRVGQEPWWDQRVTFRPTLHHLNDVYAVPLFRNPPWLAVLIAPFSMMPLHLSVLIQLILFFAILTMLTYRFGGNLFHVLLVLGSPIALDAVFEFNIEWIVAIGLCIPAIYSGPFLMIKPQVALGYWFSFRPRTVILASLIALIVVVITIPFYGLWPLDMVNGARHSGLDQSIWNVAPSFLLGWPLALAIGIVLAARAFLRKDPFTGIIAGLFFVPYVTLYSLIIPWVFVAIRHPWLALEFNVVVWLLYGAAMITYL